MVDSKTNNVICVVTHAGSLSQNKTDFNNKMKKKKEGLSKVLLQHLRTDVPVEFIENEYKDLEQCGAWTLLLGNSEKTIFLYYISDYSNLPTIGSR